MYDEILYDVSDPIATITLNRPKRLNALTDRMMAELRHAIADAEADASVAGILLTGAGRGFCAGADMQGLSATAERGATSRADLSDLSASPGDPEMEAFNVTFGYLLTVRKPILAAVNGPCAGLGLGIAALCDLRFASETAIFNTAFAARGLIAEHGTAWILPRLLGPARALDVLWSARRVEAEEAMSLGLVNRVFPGDDLIAESRAYLENLTNSVSPTSLMIMKQQVYRGLQLSFGESMREANKLMEVSLERPDFKEGVSSFLERRPPKFTRVGN